MPRSASISRSTVHPGVVHRHVSRWPYHAGPARADGLGRGGDGFVCCSTWSGRGCTGPATPGCCTRRCSGLRARRICDERRPRSAPTGPARPGPALVKSRRRDPRTTISSNARPSRCASSPPTGRTYSGLICRGCSRASGIVTPTPGCCGGPTSSPISRGSPRWPRCGPRCRRVWIRGTRPGCGDGSLWRSGSRIGPGWCTARCCPRTMIHPDEHGLALVDWCYSVPRPTDPAARSRRMVDAPRGLVPGRGRRADRPPGPAPTSTWPPAA